MKKKFSMRASKQGPDDVSVSDSLCSGVLRDAAIMDIGGSIGSSAGTNRSAPQSSSRSFRHSPSDPLPGGVADFNTQLNRNASAREFDRKPSTESATSNMTTSMHSLVPTVEEDTASSFRHPELVDDHGDNRREQRKERVKEKLERYKVDQKQLKKSCVALEEQLAQTTEKLRDVDSRAAFRIDSLEGELRETRMGMEHVAKASTREVTGQSECIKALGKKLIRQAHVIKRQKGAVGQYKMQMEALHEEMAMQDERDSHREDEMRMLQDKLKSANEKKVTTQGLLEGNIEEMTELKAERERIAKDERELKFDMQQKEASLERVAVESSEKSKRIAELMEELDKKDREAESAAAQLKESENSVHVMQTELKSASSEIEDLRTKYASWMSTSTGGGDGSFHRHSSPGALNRAASVGHALGWNRGMNKQASLGLEDADDLVETYESELQAKDATIETLAETVTEQEETIKTLQSNLVKMKSTYASDQYTKRKEIVQLKQQNATKALKLRALEKAFKCVNSSENMPKVGKNLHGHSMHGGASSTPGASIHRSGSLSQHGTSMHSESSLTSKEDKAAAVKARLGIPRSNRVHPDSLIVQQSNFFDSISGSDQANSDNGSDLGGKGENPEEC